MHRPDGWFAWCGRCYVEWWSADDPDDGGDPGHCPLCGGLPASLVANLTGAPHGPAGALVATSEMASRSTLCEPPLS